MPSARKVQVDAEDAGQRLDNLLMRLLKGVPKTHVYRVIRSGEVRLNGARCRPEVRVQGGDELRLPPMRLPQAPVTPRCATAPARAFSLLWEDEHFLAIDKPAGVAVHGGSGISHGLIEQLRSARPQASFLELVHRLDRETSGILLVACRRSALIGLQEQFRARGPGPSVRKTYAALVRGHWPSSLKVLDAPLHKYLTAQGERRVRAVSPDSPQARRAVSLVRVARRFEACTLLEVSIKTGRTHQIRVHLAEAGHPILGDDKYGDFELNRRFSRAQPGQPRMDRMFLHAQYLSFSHPATGEPVELKSPLPEDCSQCLALLQPEDGGPRDEEQKSR